MDLFDLEAMEARLGDLDRERSSLMSLIATARQYQGIVGKAAIRSAPPERLAIGRAAPIMAATEKAVGDLIDVAEKPLGTAVLLATLQDRPDLGLSGANAGNVLSARLSNSKKFIGRRGLGWWFAGRPWPGEEEENETPAG